MFTKKKKKQWSARFLGLAVNCAVGRNVDSPEAADVSECRTPRRSRRGGPGGERKRDTISIHAFSVVVKTPTTTTKNLSRLETDRNQTGSYPNYHTIVSHFRKEQILHIVWFS